VLLVIGWPDIYLCADHVPQIMEHRPIGLEGFDDMIVNASRRMGLNPEGSRSCLKAMGGCWWSLARTPPPMPKLRPTA